MTPLESIRDAQKMAAASLLLYRPSPPEVQAAIDSSLRDQGIQPGGPLEIPSVGQSGIENWRAGGGGSRETLDDLYRAIHDPILNPPVDETWADMLKKYWMYGAAAIVGIVVIKRQLK